MRFHTNNYTVELDLQNPPSGLRQNQLSVFTERLNEVFAYAPSFADICSWRDSILRYESETLLPARMDGSKQKMLLVMGNPAIHSVKNGMFFFSRADGGRHGFWGKLAKAGLVRPVPKTTRHGEALLRRKMIMDGTASDKYLVGLTTFYSFPTPGEDTAPFSGVAGVERLFESILEWLCKMKHSGFSHIRLPLGQFLSSLRKVLISGFVVSRVWNLYIGLSVARVLVVKSLVS